MRIAPAPALDGLSEFQPELARGDALVVAVIVDTVAGLDEFLAEERPAFAFENLWPEIVSPAPGHREFPRRSWSLSHWGTARNVRALALEMQRRFSPTTWGWIRPFTWGAAVGVTTVFMLTGEARRMRPTNAPLPSGNVPFAFTTPPFVIRGDRIVVTTPPLLRPRLKAQQAPDRRPARATDAAPGVRSVPPFIGGMQITSAPIGARVFVNGRLEGVTPLVIDGLTIGTRAVRIEAQDYIAWSSSVRVVANERTSVRITLTRR